jgi:hypothetical protein
MDKSKICTLSVFISISFILAGCASSPKTDQNMGKNLTNGLAAQKITNKDSNGDVTSKEIKGVLDNFYSNNKASSSGDTSGAAGSSSITK